MVSKYRSGDLVESLYTELVEKTPELKKLGRAIDDLERKVRDSSEVFDTYDAKNKSYYAAAKIHLSQIRDSVLRDRINILIEKSLTHYESSTQANKALIRAIGEKKSDLSDLHTVLKISRTLPLMEKFQKENLASTKGLKTVLKEFDEAVRYADSLSNK